MYGCEVDYAVVAPGDLPPEIELKPRQPGDSPCDPAGTYLITSGKAPRKMPSVDFGELPLQRAKVMQVMLYNRTGIATPYSAPDNIETSDRNTGLYQFCLLLELRRESGQESCLRSSGQGSQDW